MERFFGIVLVMMVALVLLGFVLQHFAMVMVVLLAVGLLGRHLRRHSA
jgi:predicted membrane protein